jgi:hypothetical protein
MIHYHLLTYLVIFLKVNLHCYLLITTSYQISIDTVVNTDIITRSV